MRVTRDQIHANRDQLRQQRVEAGTTRRARIRPDEEGAFAPLPPGRGSMAGATGLAGPSGGVRGPAPTRPTRSAVSTAGGVDLRPTGADEQARMIVARLEGFLGDRLVTVEAAAVALEARIQAAEERLAALGARGAKLDAAVEGSAAVEVSTGVSYAEAEAVTDADADEATA